MLEMELIGEVIELMRYSCAENAIIRVDNSSQVGGDECLVYHDKFLGLLVRLRFSLIRSVKRNLKSAHVQMTSQQIVRRPLTRGMPTGCGRRSRFEG